MTNGDSIHKNKGFAPQTPENDENDENQARKDPVCQKPCFCTPDLLCVFLRRSRFTKFGVWVLSVPYCPRKINKKQKLVNIWGWGLGVSNLAVKNAELAILYLKVF